MRPVRRRSVYHGSCSGSSSVAKSSKVSASNIGLWTTPLPMTSLTTSRRLSDPVTSRSFYLQVSRIDVIACGFFTPVTFRIRRNLLSYKQGCSLKNRSWGRLALKLHKSVGNIASLSQRELGVRRPPCPRTTTPLPLRIEQGCLTQFSVKSVDLLPKR